MNTLGGLTLSVKWVMRREPAKAKCDGLWLVGVWCRRAYALSQRKRKLIEQGFGWVKFVGTIRQVMACGIKKVDQLFVLTMAAYNLTRMRMLAELRPVAA